ncbi:MAG: hypothetical protein Kow00127_21790 [Bacteroidales bacterium]
MKLTPAKIVIWLTTALMLYTVLGRAQAIPELNWFTGSVSEDAVYLSWQLGAGATCLGMGVQRAGEELEFAEIHRIGGVCGDLTSPVSYTYTDTMQKPEGQLYYRIELGKGIFSDTLSLNTTPDPASPLLLYPNPAYGTVTLSYRHPDGENGVIRISDLTGRVLSNGTISPGNHTLNLTGLKQGIYLITVESAGTGFRETTRLLLQ